MFWKMKGSFLARKGNLNAGPLVLIYPTVKKIDSEEDFGKMITLTSKITMLQLLKF